MRASVRAVMAAVVMALVAVACSGGGGGASTGSSGPSASGGTAQQGGSFSIPNTEPLHLTPQNDYESAGAQVFNAVWDRLMVFDPKTFEPVPFQAESVTSDDNTVWTIKIKPGWTFHNGEPVTAQSYVDAWNWGAYGPNGAILNFFFAKIEGYDELNPSKGQPSTKELSGLKVVDDTTFQVTLTAPFSQFPVELGFDAFDPLPKAFFDDPDKFDSAPIGDGPYKLDEWKHDESITLSRYDDYAGTPGLADTINMPIYANADPQWAAFQAGDVDMVFVGSSNLHEAEQSYSDTLTNFPSSLLLYLGIPTYLPEYSDPLVRQALSLAVNREAVMTAVFPAEEPATSFAPPVIPGYRPGSCSFCTYDPAKAKELLAQAGGWQGGTMTINLYSGDATLEQGMEAIGNQWKQNLGIDFKLNVVNYNAYYDAYINHKIDGPWWDGWVMDYPSLEDYLRPIYGSEGSYNAAGYSNQQFDDLLKQGDQAGSFDESLSLYQQAQDILDQDMPNIPWGYLPNRYVHSANINGVVLATPLDNVELRKIEVVQ
jgi:peptide/nickel transport system substrate-binding protein/oligopeptide transport system substrate-binding protein